jgi:hypothetical protein
MPQVGEMFSNPDLAQALRLIADMNSSSRKGPGEPEDEELTRKTQIYKMNFCVENMDPDTMILLVAAAGD